MSTANRAISRPNLTATLILSTVCVLAACRPAVTALLVVDDYLPCHGQCDASGQLSGSEPQRVHVLDDYRQLEQFLNSRNVTVVFIGCPDAVDATADGCVLSDADQSKHSQKTAEPAGDTIAIDSRPVSPQDEQFCLVTTAVQANRASKGNLTAAEKATTETLTSGVGKTLSKIIGQRTQIIEKYAADPLVIDLVKQANARPQTIEQIKAVDMQWIAGDNSEFIAGVLKSPASRFIRKKVLSNRLLYTEGFLCDSRGATIGTYPRTSDYFQGDEAKFTDCFNKGSGRVVVGSPEFDNSTDSYSVQVSVPVIDGDRTIGVLVMGIRNVK